MLACKPLRQAGPRFFKLLQKLLALLRYFIRFRLYGFTGCLNTLLCQICKKPNTWNFDIRELDNANSPSGENSSSFICSDTTRLKWEVSAKLHLFFTRGTVSYFYLIKYLTLNQFIPTHQVHFLSSILSFFFFNHRATKAAVEVFDFEDWRETQQFLI